MRFGNLPIGEIWDNAISLYLVFFMFSAITSFKRDRRDFTTELDCHGPKNVNKDMRSLTKVRETSCSNTIFFKQSSNSLQIHQFATPLPLQLHCCPPTAFRFVVFFRRQNFRLTSKTFKPNNLKQIISASTSEFHFFFGL